MTYSFDNRKNTGLGVIELEILWDGGKIAGDPNKFIMMACEETFPLGNPVAISDISGLPAYVYRSNQIELGLTSDELYRFIRHNLEPEEQQMLLDKFGMFHEIHEDFYDEDGIAWQPVLTLKERNTFMHMCLSHLAEPEDLQKYINIWNNGDKKESLARFLGMTEKEYALVKQGADNIVYKILFERMRGMYSL